MSDKLHSFYTSKAWRDLSHRLKIERGGRSERSGEAFADLSKLIAHHKIELTENNVDDPNIALNPDNIEIISFDEHNAEHKRFGNRKRVFIVWGSPLSGKTSLVREMMRYGDLVLDIDKLWKAISFQPEYIKPSNLRFNIFTLRDNLLDQIKTRNGQFYDAYVIGGYPDKTDRERLAQSLGAELIYCDSTMQECLDRRIKSGRPDKWDEYIKNFWEIYERTGK